VVAQRLSGFSASSAPKLHPLAWLTCWGFLLLSMLFCLYWILLWGVSNSNGAYDSWAINFGYAVLEDVLFVQCFHVYVIFILSIYSIKPQLRHICRVLHHVALRYVQGVPDLHADEVKVGQHFSPACRAARSSAAAGLPAADLLLRIDDVHMEACRVNRDTHLSVVALTFISIPLLFGLLTPFLGEVALSALVPAFCSMLFLANYILLSASLAAFIVIYCLIAGFVLWRREGSKAVKE
jgi:hypothetical protein